MLTQAQDFGGPVGGKVWFGYAFAAEAEADVAVEPVQRGVRARDECGQQRFTDRCLLVDGDQEFTLVVRVQVGQPACHS